MPDLSLQATHFNWFETQDTESYDVVCMMEMIESWTHDGAPEVEAAIEKLGLALDHVENIDLKEKDDFLTLCAYIKTGRFLSIMLHLDSAYPGAAAKLIRYAESKAHVDETAALFLKRNVIYERMLVALRVFAPGRLKVLKASLEKEGHE